MADELDRPIAGLPKIGTLDRSAKIYIDQGGDYYCTVDQLLALVPSYGAQSGEWSYNANTTTDPSSGQIKLNTTSQPDATRMFIHKITGMGVDAQNLLILMIKPGAQLLLQEKDNSANYIVYNVTGDPVEQGNHIEVPISMDRRGGNLPAQKCVLAVVPA